jgi:hypothetical protein
MKLGGQRHLAYCTNVHRGESWAETFQALETHVLPVRQRVAPGRSYAIGLRLGQRAAAELAQRPVLAEFQRWLERHDCYVFTINGFPFGSFHGGRVKEQVYAPDWSEPARLEYTKQLFDLLAVLARPETGGSVSTVPGSFKGFVAAEPGRRDRIFAQLSDCTRYIDALGQRTGIDLHLGLEPEPMCLLETTAETVAFFREWRERDPAMAEPAARRCVGVNYDCCHLAVEFERAGESLEQLAAADIRLSKLHLSSALRLRPTAEARAALRAFDEPVYLHQVVTAAGGQVRRRFLDLAEALAAPAEPNEDEWRVHFHIPLHASPGAPFLDTRDHLLGALDWLRAHPAACGHLEMETYTWEVLPDSLRSGVQEQLVGEYAWTLRALQERGLAEGGGKKEAGA